jgi:hypothetical protein
MPNPYTNIYMPTGFEDADQQGMNPVFQNIGSQQQYFNQQLGQGSEMAQPTSRGVSLSGLNPLAMAMALRGKGGNVQLPASNLPQMTNVPGMGDAMGTGLTQGSGTYGSINPYATGGYGIKF